MTEGQKARALVTSITAHHVNMRRECDAIDRVHESSARRNSSVGAHSDTREKVKLAPDSIYDLCEGRNPALASILRKMQALAYK